MEDGTALTTAALVCCSDDDGTPASNANAEGQSAELVHVQPLPAGLSRPGLVDQLLAFLPKWPIMLTSLIVVVEVACDTDTRVRQTDGVNSPRRVLSLCAVAWPLLTAVYLSHALTETLCRQWVWYRLLEQRVVMNFTDSELGLIDRINTDRGIWLLLLGWALIVANELVNGTIGQAMDADCPENVHLAMVSLMMTHIFFVTEAESSQLPTINGFVKGNFVDNVQLLETVRAQGGFVPEAVVAAACLDAVPRDTEVSWGAIAENSKQLNAGGGVASANRFESTCERLSRKPFWAMQLMGLSPLSGIASRYSRRRLRHAADGDRQFSLQIKVWHLLFLLVPCVVEGARGWPYFGPWFTLGFGTVVALPTVQSLWIN
eukprot:COSAG02_NODE_20_length_53673_cov_86.864841_35_plen_375_part_00